MSLVEGGRQFRESAEPPESHIQMPQENFAPPFLTRLAELVGGLNVGVGGKEKDQITHR